MDENENIPYQIDFPVGRTVSNRWKILARIGTGAYGVVYSVSDTHNKVAGAVALKVELIQEGEFSMLKQECEVLQRLQQRPHTIRLFGAGKRSEYNFVVMTLCGIDLARLKAEKKLTKFSDSSMLRIGVHALYTIKQLHEVGYVHRDIKPQNFVFGGGVKDARMLYLIDYGMVRQYAMPDESKSKPGEPIAWIIRRPRRKVHLRGTLRYCSVNVHKRIEQGRADDLFSLVYMLAEMKFPLPWAAAQREERLMALKEEFPNNPEFKQCEGLRDVLGYIQNVKYAERPDYKFVYGCLMDVIKKKGYKFTDPYDWEEGGGERRSLMMTAMEDAGGTAGNGSMMRELETAKERERDKTITETTIQSDMGEPVEELIAKEREREPEIREARERSKMRSSTPPTHSPHADPEKAVRRMVPSEDSGKRPVRRSKSEKGRQRRRGSSLKLASRSKYSFASAAVVTASATPAHDASRRRASRPTSSSSVMKEVQEVRSVVRDLPTAIERGEEHLYPTMAAAAFDFRPGDVPSSASMKPAPAAHPTTPQSPAAGEMTQEKDPDTKNLKSVISNYNLL